MKLSKKDQSFLLLITAVTVVFYSIYSLFSYLFFTATFYRSDVSQIVSMQTSEKTQQWFNTSRPLEVSDLKNRVILLNFWNYDCIECDHSLLKVKKLERKYSGKLTVIGVHSNKSDENDVAEITKSILKNNILYPVVNDFNSEVSNAFKVTNVPSMVLINISGEIEKSYMTKKEIADLDKDIEIIISKSKYKITHEPLPLFFEKNSAASNVLSFPTKLEYVKSFNYKSRNIPAIIIANSGKNNIVVTNLLGEIILKIGGDVAGFDDGSFEEATFSYPKDLIYRDNKLYVIDAGNDALREIDFENETVTTLVAGGDEIVSDKAIDAKNASLRDPSALEFLPDNKNIVIANSGTSQLFAYNIEDKKIAILSHNNSEDISPKKSSDNLISYVSDFAVYAGKLYFIDAKSSALRILDKGGDIKTLVDGSETGSLSNPAALLVDDTGAYITDASTQMIKRYDFSTKSVRNFVGNKNRGDDIGSGSSTQFDDPAGIVAILNSFYISDSGNNRILAINRGNLKAELFDVLPLLKLSKEGFLQYLPNLQKSEKLLVAAGKELSVEISLKKGWKLNEKGPSFINLLEIKKENKADLLASFDWNAIIDDNIKLTKLDSSKDYTLQGVIYYCEDKKNALCYVKSYEQKVSADNHEKNDKIIVEL
jgi:thiol-disulfide isomerase/thioredoxin